MKKWYWYRIVKNNNPYLEAVSLHAQAREQVGLVRKQLCMDMSVITQLYCQLYITCQLHVSANTIFGHHQVRYNFRRKLHNIQGDSLARGPKLLSLGPIERQSVQKYTPHTRTTQRRYTPRDSSRQRRHFGRSIPEFGETHSSVLGCERRPVSASIMSRSCFASFPVCVYKFSSHYLNNIIFYRQ